LRVYFDAKCKTSLGWRAAGNDTLWSQAYGLFRQQFVENSEPDESVQLINNLINSFIILSKMLLKLININYCKFVKITKGIARVFDGPRAA